MNLFGGQAERINLCRRWVRRPAILRQFPQHQDKRIFYEECRPGSRTAPSADERPTEMAPHRKPAPSAHHQAFVCSRRTTSRTVLDTGWPTVARIDRLDAYAFYFQRKSIFSELEAASSSSSPAPCFQALTVDCGYGMKALMK